MDFLLRADATPAMGTGHVMRCLALAEALLDLGHGAQVASVDIVPALAARLGDEGVPVHRLDPDADRDAAATARLADRLGVAGIVVDGYHFGADWRQALYEDSRERGRTLLSFDDAAAAPSPWADWVVNPAVPERPDLPGCLFGPFYIPLRREIRRAAAAILPVAARPAILVTFGGSDPAGLSLPVAAALVRLSDGAVPIEVVLGGAVPGAEDVAAGLAALGPAVTVQRNLRDMGPPMLRAGLAVSAAGGTLGELAALAVPAVIATVADNQLQGAAASVRDGWCVARDGRRPKAAENLAETALRLWRDPAERQAMADRARGIVTADGALRIARALLGNIQVVS
jgi:spore coat polysaccharide biosynthesis predicted glycosyltransferase SpsG